MAVFWTPIAESDMDDILYYISVVDRRPEIVLRLKTLAEEKECQNGNTQIWF